MSRWLVFVFIWGIPWTGTSQQLSIDSLCSWYPFIQWDSNYLQFPGGMENWNLGIQKIQRIQKGSSEQFKLLHIGGSHVQGGVLSGTIRDRIAELFPAHRGFMQGFIFPYVLAETNSPAGLLIDETGEWTGSRRVKNPDNGPYGISAINAITTDPFSSVHMRLRKDKGLQYYKSVRIFADLAHATLWPEPFSFECPDSIVINEAAGFLEWHYANEQDAVEMVFMPCDNATEPIFVLQGIQFLDDSSAMVHHMVGANGASLNTYLRCEKIELNAAALAPDMVIFGIGVNDAYVPNGRFDQPEFEMRYDSLIRIFQRANPETVFIFITNNDTYYKRRSVNKNVFAVQESMMRLAKKHQAALWDQFGIMGGLQAIVKWQHHGLAKKDKVHFTSAGYSLVGNLFADAFIAAFFGISIHQNRAE